MILMTVTNLGWNDNHKYRNDNSNKETGRDDVVMIIKFNDYKKFE